MTNTYENILRAIGNKNTLSTQERADNYSAFSKMMDDGIYIPDLLKKLDSMETRLKDLEKAPKQEMDTETFAVMEAAVKDDTEVIGMREHLMDERMRVISEMCMRDDAYRKAYEDYRRVVNARFVRFKTESHPEICQGQTGQSVAPQSTAQL